MIHLLASGSANHEFFILILKHFRVTPANLEHMVVYLRRRFREEVISCFSPLCSLWKIFGQETRFHDLQFSHRVLIIGLNLESHRLCDRLLSGLNSLSNIFKTVLRLSELEDNPPVRDAWASVHPPAVSSSSGDISYYSVA